MGLDDPSGDVLDDRETEARNRATLIRVTSPSRHSEERLSQTGSRPSHDSGHSTSIQRVGTNASLQARERNHKNRFFSRNRHADEEAAMEDIPEADSPNHTKIDARTGLISPRAMHSSDEMRLPFSSGALPTTADSDRTFSHPSRAQTDSYEMHRMR
jgi:hypothetical protein